MTDVPTQPQQPSRWGKLASVVDTIATAAQGAGQTVAVTVQGVGQAATDGARAVGDKIADVKADIKPMEYVKSFAATSVNIVQEIDDYLLETNSQYEVANFNVSGNISVLGGMQLVINFSKTKAARDLQARAASTASGSCPSCGTGWTVEKAKLAGRDVAGLRCQSCQHVFQVETKTFTVVHPVEGA